MRIEITSDEHVMAEGFQTWTVVVKCPNGDTWSDTFDNADDAWSWARTWSKMA